MPQPGAEKVEDIGEKAMDVLRQKARKRFDRFQRTWRDPISS